MITFSIKKGLFTNVCRLKIWKDKYFGYMIGPYLSSNGGASLPIVVVANFKDDKKCQS